MNWPAAILALHSFPYTTLFRSTASCSAARPRWCAGSIRSSPPSRRESGRSRGLRGEGGEDRIEAAHQDRQSTRLNSSHRTTSYAVCCLEKKTLHRDDSHEAVHL